MARSIARVDQGESLDLQLGGAQAFPMDGRLGEKDDVRVLRRKSSMRVLLSSQKKGDGKKRSSYGNLARRSIKLQPQHHLQQQQQWETETVSTCATSTSTTLREQEEPVHDHLLPSHNEVNSEDQDHEHVTERRCSLHNVEVQLSKHKEILQQQQQQQQWQWRENDATVQNERYDAHRRHDIGEVKRKGMKNNFNYDPPSAKSCHYHYQNQSGNAGSDEVNDGSDDCGDDKNNIEANEEADDDAVSKSSGSAKSGSAKSSVVRPWHRPENNVEDVAMHGNTRDGSKERNTESRKSLLMRSKDRSSGSLGCELEKAVDALAQFSKTEEDVNSEEEKNSEDEGYQHKQFLPQQARNVNDRRQLMKSFRGCTSNKSFNRTRTKKSKKTPVTLFEVFDWYYGGTLSSLSPSNTTGKKKKRRKSRRLSHGSRCSTDPLPVSTGQKRFLIASTKKREPKSKQRKSMSKEEIQNHNAILLAQQERIMKQSSFVSANSRDRMKVDVKDSIEEDSTPRSKNEPTRQGSHHENLSGILCDKHPMMESDLLANVNASPSRKVIINTHPRRNPIKTTTTEEEQKISPSSIINKQKSEEERSKQSAKKSNIMKFLTAAPTVDDDLFGEKTTNLFDIPTAFDLKEGKGSLFGDGESSLFGDGEGSLFGDA